MEGSWLVHQTKQKKNKVGKEKKKKSSYSVCVEMATPYASHSLSADVSQDFRFNLHSLNIAYFLRLLPCRQIFHIFEQIPFFSYNYVTNHHSTPHFL